MQINLFQWPSLLLTMIRKLFQYSLQITSQHTFQFQLLLVTPQIVSTFTNVYIVISNDEEQYVLLG